MEQERILEKQYPRKQFRLKIGDETIAETDGEDAVEADSQDLNEDDGNWQNANPATFKVDSRDLNGNAVQVTVVARASQHIKPGDFVYINASGTLSKVQHGDQQ